MKSSLKWVCCFVFVLSATAHAGSLTLTASNLGNGQIAIGYEVTSGSDVPVGLGLNVTLTNGATFAGVVSASSYFPTYPGTINIDHTTGVVTDYGSPVSPSDPPGVLGGIGTNGITLEMAANLLLQETGLEPQDIRDFNWDGLIDYFDMAIFVNEWRSSNDPALPWADPDLLLVADINRDFYVDMKDLSLFLGNQASPLNLSQLVILQIDMNGAASTTLLITPEATYCSGVVDGYGNAFAVTPASIIIPEPATMLLLGLGGMMIRKFKSKS